MRKTVATVALAAGLTVAGAQTLTVDHYTQSQLIEKAQALNAKAQGPDGAASVKLNEVREITLR